MKKSAKYRIIIWSIVAVLLVGLLVFGMTVTSNISGLNIFTDNQVSDIVTNAKDTSSQSDYSTDDVNKIQVKFSSGKLTIKKSSDNKIHIEKQSENNKEDQIKYKLSDDNKLVIYDNLYNSNKFMMNWFMSSDKKNITISVPENFLFDNIKVECISADISVDNFKAKKCTLSSTSGNLRIDNADCKQLEIESTSGKIIANCKVSDELSINTVSGDANINTNCKKIIADAVSGKIDITADKNVNSIKTDSVSGDCVINVPKDIAGFSLDFDTVSGEKSCQFTSSNEDSNIVYGNGTANFDVQTVSGNVDVNYSDK